MIISESADSIVYYNLSSSASPEVIDPDSDLQLDQQTNLFKIFTGINVHCLLRDLECVQIGQMDYHESDIYRVRPDTNFLWNLVETNIEDIISYARFCIEKTRYFPKFSRQRFTDEQ